QPLTLWINAHGRPNGHKEVADLQFMPLVAANAQRWVEISISLCDDGTLLDPLMALPLGSFKILSRACINFFNLTVRNGEKTATQDTRLCNALHASPNLTTPASARNQSSTLSCFGHSSKVLASAGCWQLSHPRQEFLPNTSTHLLRYTLKTSSPVLERKHRAGFLRGHARDAPADVGSTSSATGDLELALEARRREALKRVLTQPEYPTHGAGSKPAKPSLNPNSNSMTRRQAHNSQLPINRLPNELLCAIFFVCGDPSPASAFPRDPTMHDAHINPLNLKSYSRNVVLFGLVCSRWYHVTHGFPALWTIVDVEYPARYATNILKRCLAHSAGLPLTLWISESVNPRFYTDDEDPDPRFMILVAANAHRWKEMSIELYDKSDVLAPLIALPPGAFGNLYRARVSFFRRGADATSPDTRLWKSWLTSPKLNTVDWVKIEHIRSGLAVAPLRQLTSIGLHVAEPAMLASVLNSCVNLELLHVDINPYRLGMKNIPPLTLASPICLPHLRTMIICGPNDWAPLFKALTVPALCRLELSRQEIHSHDIMDMLHRSRARLRMFTVHWPKVIQADQMLALLHSEPMRNIQVVRYDRYPPGGARRGWEDAFDLQPFVPSHVRYTTDYDEAENFYEGLEDT
ncbi:hypothetical protein K523DRAFT_328590, partial [Schizophyllum commune Tattone D]